MYEEHVSLSHHIDSVINMSGMRNDVIILKFLHGRMWQAPLSLTRVHVGIYLNPWYPFLPNTLFEKFFILIITVSNTKN